MSKRCPLFQWLQGGGGSFLQASKLQHACSAACALRLPSVVCQLRRTTWDSLGARGGAFAATPLWRGEHCHCWVAPPMQ
eukprot:3427420-Amphidinium_carterae.1